MTFNYEETNYLGFSTEVKIGDSIFKNDNDIFGRRLNRRWEMYNVGMIFLCSLLKKMWNIFEI